MKKKSIMAVMCLAGLCAVLSTGCGTKKEDSENEVAEQYDDDEETVTADNGNETDTSDGEVTEGELSDTVSEEEDKSFFASHARETDKMVEEALAAYNAGDYTALDEPVGYNVLWLGFSHVTYEDLDFQMTESDREYLKDVALNYEKSLESITEHNLDITVDLHIIDDEVPLTKYYNEDWLYLAQESVQQYIDQYSAGKDTDTVLTTVQTAGEENISRNEDKDGYGIHYVMLGLQTAGMNSPMGYSTFDLGKPVEGTYPLEDPEIPSLSATAVAVHEWMHQLEYMGTLLGIEYPNTHAYMGPDQFPGYEEYISGENDYDFFEFYKLVLTGKLPYTNGGSVQYVGMYPKMWPLIKRDVYNVGSFTIKAADGQGYLAGQTEDPTLTVSDDPCVWNIRYSGDGRYILSPADQPDKLVDLGNAWDNEGNTIGLWIYTGYVEAQSWHIIGNADGTYSLQTPYESGRLITVSKGQGALLCSEGADGIQKWTIEKAVTK